MAYRVLRDFSSTSHGNVSADQIIEVGHDLAVQWRAAGMIEPVEPAGKGDGEEAPTSASQADRASPDGSADTYETKPLRRSPRTPASAPSKKASSTAATESGGTTTPKKSAPKGSKAGRKTPKPRGGTN